MKTFNYESNCVKYRGCYFDVGEYKNGNVSLSIYGYVEDEKNISHISNATVNVDENLRKNNVVIDTYANTNLISFLLDLGIAKGITKRVNVESLSLPVIELDLDKLYEYSYNYVDEQEGLRYAS
ncbi:MAG: hypothetical protein HFJ51_04640 [Clostridia bacterium]|nr:hypothetical protein [Clostridia bacterium]